MKALVVGAAGQLGCALLAAAPAGWRCTGLCRADLDIRDRDAVRSAIAREAPDLLFNAAAYTAVDRAEAEPDLAMAINADGVANLAAALGKRGGRLVQISTDYVFSGNTAQAYPPDAGRDSLSVYGRTKAAGEDAAGADALIVRTSWLYSTGHPNFVTTMLGLMRARTAIDVVDDQIGCPTWAAGLAEVLWALAIKRATGVWHHRDAGIASWYDLAVAVAEEAAALGSIEPMPQVRPIPTSAYPTAARRPAISILDNRATQAALGRAPPHWRVNLRKMLSEEACLG